jgi:mannose-6-phosphate isomerase-like protein (cupin superfamily)
MKTFETYLNTGILEMYVLGVTSDEENLEITAMSEIHPEIRDEIDQITENLMNFAEKSAPPVNPTTKPMIMAIIDYTQRLENGEAVTFPPLLHEHSTIEEYASWLNRADMILPVDFKEEIYAKLIGSDTTAMTAILWIKGGCGTPYEIHDVEYEKFLIVEGTCDIITDERTYSLVAGDYLTIPLHIGHVVNITSKTPCKAILQRVAA